MKFLTVALLLIVGAAKSNAENPPKITLFYESYCPDCTGFIQTQLVKAWNSFSNNILLDLVPFGNARQILVDGHWVFDCQHGPKECLANKLHACVILQACGEGGTVSCHVDNVSHVVNYIDCVTRETDQLEATIRCAKKEGLHSQDIMDCSQGPTGDRLLNFYGNQTLAFTPRIGYVPTVAINGKHVVDAEKDLTAEICKLRPNLCQQPQPPGKPLNITLFYESYCPDCTGFIQTQLVKAWNSFSNSIFLDLVPFGNARQRFIKGHWQFHCQHGPKECLANKLHACVILQACGEGGTVSCHVDNVSHVVNYIDCVTWERDQLEATIRCAKKEGLHSQDIMDCAQGPTGDRLLNLYGNQTLAFTPRIGYVPTVAINGKHVVDAEKDLTAEICKLRPNLCQQPEPSVIIT